MTGNENGGKYTCCMRSLADQGHPNYWITLEGRIWSEKHRDEGEWLTPHTMDGRNQPYFTRYRANERKKVGIATVIAKILYPEAREYRIAYEVLKAGVGSIQYLDGKEDARFDNVIRCEAADLIYFRIYRHTGIITLPNDAVIAAPQAFGFERRDAHPPHPESKLAK